VTGKGEPATALYELETGGYLFEPDGPEGIRYDYRPPGSDVPPEEWPAAAGTDLLNTDLLNTDH